MASSEFDANGLKLDTEINSVLIEHMLNGVAYCKMLYQDGKPCDFIYLYVNPAFEQLTGLKNVAGKHVSEVIPNIREKDSLLLEIYSRVAQGGEPERFETFLESLKMWFWVSVYSPKPDHFVAIFDVITEQKNNELALAQINERWSLAQSVASIGIWDWDIVNNQASFNSEYFKLLGLPQNVSHSYENFLSALLPEDRPKVQTTVQHSLENGIEQYEIEYRLKRFDDGSIRWMRSKGRFIFSDGIPSRGLGIIIDITEGKLAEVNLRKSESQLRFITDNAPILIAQCDHEKRYKFVNQQYAQLFGLKPTDIIGKHPREILGEEAYAHAAPYMEVALSGNETGYDLTLPTTSHGPVVVAVHYHPECDTEGQVIGFVAAITNITERKRAEEILRFHSKILNNLAEGIFLIRVTDETIVFVNPKFACMFGYDPSELLGKHVSIVNATSDKSPVEVAAAIIGELEQTGWWSGEVKNIKKDGTIFLCHASVTVLEHPEFGLVWASEHEDITRRKQIEQEQRIAAIAFQSQEGIMITDEIGNLIRVNEAFTRITGYTPDEVIGKNPRILTSGRQDAAFYEAMWASINRKDAWEGEIWNRRKNGEIYPEHLTITAVKDAHGIVTNFVATLFDISRSKQSEDTIKNLAFYDPLTELPNRRLLMDRLHQALAYNVHSCKQGAVMMIDLDNFKMLNDSHGHAQGDLLLKLVAQRLTSCVREGDTVARLGGDEFVVILEDLSEDLKLAAIQAGEVGQKLLTNLNHPYQLGKHEYQNTPSIGITLFNKTVQEKEELLKQADIAMYQAKRAGRNTLRFFNYEMQECIIARSELENELRVALGNGQFQLHYQIQVNNLNQPCGAEALIRWLHPKRGLVSPALFIPLAEETGIIVTIGHWVLETACLQLKAWQQDELTRHLILSVNVSAKQYRETEFVTQVKSAILRHDINPQLLKLELTESIMVDDIEETIRTMHKLREIGIQISLDDFGTGYSSLQYLKRLPLYQLKIDQSFVRDISIDENDIEIVRTIIGMGKAMNLNVIAEGVETEEQRVILEQCGCFAFQGYLFGRPEPIEQLEIRLKQNWE